MTPTMEQIKEWMTDAGISHLSEPLERFAALAFAAGQSSVDAAREDAARYEHILKHARRIDIDGLCVTDMDQLSGRIDRARGGGDA